MTMTTTRKLSLFLFVLTLSLQGVASAQTSVQQNQKQKHNLSPTEDNFIQHLKRMKNIQADFREVIKSDKKIILESSGKMVIERPGKFRWDTNKPNHQLIVADGNTLWIYDADLDQVSIKQQRKALRNSPALLLSDPDISLFHHFRVTNVAPDQFVLTPKAEGTHFSEIKLSFKNANLSSMQLSDEMGQNTYLQFNHVVTNSKINPVAFSFIIPHGVDIIRE